jgi:SAM-dependent methyltransferase
MSFDPQAVADALLLTAPPCLCGARDYRITLVSDIYRVYARDDAPLEFMIATCCACGLARTLPVGEEVHAQPYRDAEQIRPYLDRPGLYQRLMLRTVRELRALCPPPARLFELGSAVGILLHLAEEAGYEVTGLELNEAAVEVARPRFGERLLAVPLEQAPLPPGSFDVVVMSAVAEHLLDLPHLLERMRSLLRPEGALLIANTPNWGSPVARWLGERWYGLQPTGHAWQFSLRTLGAVLERAGFHVVLRRTYPMYRDHQGLMNRPKRAAERLMGGLLLADALSVGARLGADASALERAS